MKICNVLILCLLLLVTQCTFAQLPQLFTQSWTTWNSTAPSSYCYTVQGTALQTIGSTDNGERSFTVVRVQNGAVTAREFRRYKKSLSAAIVSFTESSQQVGTNTTFADAFEASTMDTVYTRCRDLLLNVNTTSSTARFNVSTTDLISICGAALITCSSTSVCFSGITISSYNTNHTLCSLPAVVPVYIDETSMRIAIGVLVAIIVLVFFGAIGFGIYWIVKNRQMIAEKFQGKKKNYAPTQEA